MSDQTRIEATLGQMFRDHFFDSPHEDTRCCVEEFLEALKANRIALIELPEPSYEDDTGGIGFNGGPGDREIAAERGVYVFGGGVFDQWDGVNPDQARKIGSWWIAAAAAAEVTE
ncbi:hypothetical protein THIBAULT_75 [Mycobacterium phage Thibault]|uniref:Uncharacterized protein n=1 Tax=Mycobacterium phage Thibault TaxID=1052673 RepID=G1FGE0_9CAUD|nr:DNA methyltransferase [Mycobacterium phage Thibault]AEJ94000.1 hypothetical protein THIBAULT_75 [Mycobacterium phage Thibault]